MQHETIRQQFTTMGFTTNIFKITDDENVLANKNDKEIEDTIMSYLLEKGIKSVYDFCYIEKVENNIYKVEFGLDPFKSGCMGK